MAVLLSKTSLEIVKRHYFCDIYATGLRGNCVCLHVLRQYVCVGERERVLLVLL